MTSLAVPQVDEPVVSVVIVLYGGWEIARSAIAHLVDNTEPCYELLLIDNASPGDAAARAEAEISGARAQMPAQDVCRLPYTWLRSKAASKLDGSAASSSL